MIHIKKYSNGTYSYLSSKGHRNIPKELAEQIIDVKKYIYKFLCYRKGNIEHQVIIQVTNHKSERLPHYKGIFEKDR